MWWDYLCPKQKYTLQPDKCPFYKCTTILVKGFTYVLCLLAFRFSFVLTGCLRRLVYLGFCFKTRHTSAILKHDGVQWVNIET